MAIAELLLPEFDHEVGTTRKLLERVPDAELAWKPHGKSMSLGELASHISLIPVWAGTILDATSFDMAAASLRPEPKSSTADIVSAFDAGARATRARLTAKSDPEMTALWTLKRGADQVLSVPRIGALRGFIMNHLIHHRGQLSVYLRLLNVPVPSMYGPSADES